jgi:hypothetical protein
MKLLALTSIFLCGFITPLVTEQGRAGHERAADVYRYEVAARGEVRSYDIEHVLDPVPLRGTLLKITERHRKLDETSWTPGESVVIRFLGVDAASTIHLQYDEFSASGQRSDPLFVNEFRDVPITVGDREALTVTLRLYGVDGYGRAMTKFKPPAGATKMGSR